MWQISCTDHACEENTRAREIVDLLHNHRDPNGWFRCRCGQRGYVAKSFDLQEPGDVWEPFLMGAIALGEEGSTYQPFVFLVGDSAEGAADQVWFSYYKDLRPRGGRLKMGYGPGGPPVLAVRTVVQLSEQLLHRASLGDSA